jgi:hypothetical protein
MISLIIDILGLALGPLWKVLKSVFVLPPEEKQRREDAAKVTRTIDRLDSADPGFVVPDSAGQDRWGPAVEAGARVESPKQDDAQRRAG